MYFSAEMIRAAETRYGSPRRLRLKYPTPQAHFDFIRPTQRDGRVHDVRPFALNENTKNRP